MIQLKTSGAVLAPYLSRDSDSTKPPNPVDEARSVAWAGQADLTDVPFVSPPPMPWPRVFPSL